MWFGELGWVSPFGPIENEEIRSWAHCEHIRDEEVEARIHIEEEPTMEQGAWQKAA